jgi:hypothetical protein
MESGFMRRFLWASITVSNGWMLMDAISRWSPLNLGEYKTKSPGNRNIPYNVPEDEDKLIRSALKDQVGTTTPFVLLKKVCSVLHWKYDRQEPSRAREIIEDFIPALSRDGAEIVLKDEEVVKITKKAVTGK